LAKPGVRPAFTRCVAWRRRSGFFLSVRVADAPNADDLLIERAGARVVIARMSLGILGLDQRSTIRANHRRSFKIQPETPRRIAVRDQFLN